MPVSEYDGKLLQSSGSYLNAIEVCSPDFLIHPDQITNEDKMKERLQDRKSNGPFSQPFSKGCQIMKLSDFNETVNILHNIGFEYDNKNSIKIKIKDPQDD